jgi:hypothetical protein
VAAGSRFGAADRAATPGGRPRRGGRELDNRERGRRPRTASGRQRMRQADLRKLRLQRRARVGRAPPAQSPAAGAPAVPRSGAALITHLWPDSAMLASLRLNPCSQLLGDTDPPPRWPPATTSRAPALEAAGQAAACQRRVPFLPWPRGGASRSSTRLFPGNPRPDSEPCSGLAAWRAWRGAPLKPFVEKVVTARADAACPAPLDASMSCQVSLGTWG